MSEEDWGEMATGTPEERAERWQRKCLPGWPWPDSRFSTDLLVNEFRAAIAKEREACAKLVEGSEYMGDDMKTHPITHRDALAVAIRARAQEGDT